MSGSGFQVNCAGEVSEVRKFLNSNESGRNDYYLMYMQGGELDLRVGGLKRKLCAGQMICFAPHTPYSYNNHGSDEPIRYYWIHFTGSEASTFVDSCELPLGEVYHVGLHPEMDTVFENLFSEFRRDRDRRQTQICLYEYICIFESEVAQSCLTLCDPWTVAHQVPPSMGFSRQEYWSE